MYSKISLMTFPLVKSWVGQPIMTAEESVGLVHEAGLSSIDLLDIPAEEIDAYLEAFQKYPVKVRCNIGYIPFLEEQEVVKEKLEDTIKKTCRLGAGLLMIVPYNPVFDPAQIKELGRKYVREKMIEGFQLAVDMAKPYDFQVCFETTPQDEFCLSGNEDCLAVLQAVPGLGLVLDTANMLPHGDNTMEAYELLKDYIVHVHLKDVALIDPDTLPQVPYYRETSADGRIMQGVVWGQGVIPIRELYKRMEADGYTGMYAIEYVLPEENLGDADTNLAQIRRFLDVLS